MMCRYTLLQFCLFFSFCFTINAVPPCDDEGELFFLDGQLIQVDNFSDDNSISLAKLISPCQPDRPVEVAELNIEYVLQNVTWLQIMNVRWSVSLPESSRLEVIDIVDITPTVVWGECSHLTNVYLKNVNFTYIPLGAWLVDCNKLQELGIRDIDISEIPAMLNRTPHLEILNIHGIVNIESILRQPLFSAERPHRYIKSIRLSTISNIIEDNSTWAEISSSLSWQLSLLPELQYLVIEKFKHFDFCLPGTPITYRKLQFLNIWDSKTSQLCFRQLRVIPLLQELRIDGEHIKELQFSEFFSSVAPSLNIYIFKGESAILRFSRADFISLTDGPRNGNVLLTLEANLLLDCECDVLLWLSRAIDEHLLTIRATYTKCIDGLELGTQPCKPLMCSRVICHVSCVCCYDKESDTLKADCQDANLTNLPTELLVNNLTDLIVSNNSLSSLPNFLPKNLHTLDLSKNKISHLPGSVVSALFAEEKRQIRFSGNPIDCSCDNRYLLKALQNHKNQVVDFKNITCAEDGKKLSKINVTGICRAKDLEIKLGLEREESKIREQILASVIAVAVVATAVTGLIAVATFYHKQLRIFFFARGWCLCCIREEELDADRQYDVFLSFCHEDQDIILNELLPPLYREYSVCIHLRDWWPGETIPTQITASVEQSRRTIVFMSKAFLKSSWGVLEFRTAYMISQKEGRFRIVMIVLDDVLESEILPKEVQSYVRYNTYVRWDDPWLWEKLRYALPHRPTASVNRPNQLHLEYTSPSAPPLMLPICEENIIEQQREIELQEVSEEEIIIRENDNQQEEIR